MSSVHMLVGDRYTFTDWPVTGTGAIDTVVMDAVAAWLRRHGVDPHDVMIPGRIIRDPIGRRVVWTACKHAEQHRATSHRPLMPHPACIPVERHVQLEAAPGPWPRELVVYVYRNRPADDRPGFRLD